MRGLAGFVLATVVPTVFLSFASVIVILISCVVGNEKQILPFVGAIWSASFLVMLAAAFGYIGDTLLDFAHFTTEGACRMTVYLLGSDEFKHCNNGLPTSTPKQPNKQETTETDDVPGHALWSI